MGAGVQFKGAWIPACAGMTDRYLQADINNILINISGIPHYMKLEKLNPLSAE
jgi:hypothetical protein